MSDQRLNSYIINAYKTFKPLYDLYNDNNIDIDNGKFNFAELPFMTKERLSGYSVRDKFAVPFKNISRIFTTSGTTDKPQFIAFTKNDWETAIDILCNSFKISGVTSNDIFYDLIPKNTTYAGNISVRAAERLGAMVIPAGKMETEQHIRVIQEVLPTVLNGLAFFMIKIAAQLPVNVRECVKIIFAVGEYLYDETRNALKELYPNAVVCSGYGISEVFLSNECRMNNGVHYDSEKVMVEVINKNDQGIGELVFTSLYSEAMPLVRYRSGDVGILLSGKCPCGCSMPRLKVLGRLDSMFNIKGKLFSVDLLKKTVYSEQGMIFCYCIYYPNDSARFEIIYSGEINEEHLKHTIKQKFDITPELINNNNINEQWKHRFISERV